MEKTVSFFGLNFQNILNCRICTMLVEKTNIYHIPSSKLSTYENPQNPVKIKLSSKLSTFSTKMCVD
ncbi:hypothetical protein K040078D81_57370 [Blautia hominis]|uniref:Uncharacterized protein n=1 Tax=Blautia hominis TaxID=2025493 RepID=A0ABQ0BJI5_9FIRM